MSADPIETEHGRERYHFLDGLRGIAAIIVMLFHFGWAAGLEAYVFPHAYLVVDFFFLLSGFVIADAYEARLSSGQMSFRTFVTARLVRLYPMIFVGMALALLVQLGLAFGTDTSHHFPQSGDNGLRIWQMLVAFCAGILLEPWLYYAGSATFRFGFPLNIVMWSMFWEIVANLAFAFVAPRVRWRVWWLVAIGFLCVLVPYCLLQGGLGQGHAVWHSGFVRVGFSFFAGIVLWHLRALCPALKLPPGISVLAMVAVSALPLSDRYNALIDIGAVTILFPLLILAGSRVLLGKRAVSVATWLGAISYPLYATHFAFQPLLKLLLIETHLSPASRLLAVVVAGTVMIGTSHLLLLAIDLPMRRRLRELIAVRNYRRVQAAP